MKEIFESGAIRFSFAETYLTILFVVLKLNGTIDWSWWWVFLPLWGGVALYVVATGTVALVRELISYWARKGGSR